MRYLDGQAKATSSLTFGGGVQEVQRELIAMFGMACPGRRDEQPVSGGPVVEPGATTAHDRIMAEADRIMALGEASEPVAPYKVNQPTIGTWLDAMGYDNDRFHRRGATVDGAQVWTMPGLGRRRPPTTR